MSAPASTHHGRVSRYGLYQVREYALGPALLTLLITFVLGVFPVLLIVVRTEGVPGASPVQVPPQMIDMLVGVMATLGSMLATARMVSDDRSPGLARFLFAKPVRVRRYYLQAWAVRGAALLTLALVVMLGVDQLLAPVPWPAGLGSVAAAFVLIGGVGLLASVVTAKDGAIVIAAYLIPDLISSVIPLAPSWGWVLKPILAIMPPMHKLDDVRRALLTDAALPQADLLHVLAYGAGCVALAIYLVRRLPLVR